MLFLSGPQGPQFMSAQANCPIVSAITSGVTFSGTKVGHSFHITTDVPAVAYQINPYGGGSAAMDPWPPPAPSRP